MNYKNIFLLILIITIISTVCILALKPKMHKNTLIYNSEYTIVQKEEPVIKEENIPTITQQEQVKTVQQRLQENVEKETVLTPVQKTTVKKENKVPKKQVQTVSVTQEKPVVKKTEVKKEPVKQQQTTAVEVQKPKEQIKVVQKAPEPVKKVQVQEVAKPPVTLTKEQEEIAWNVWRSNLQNQIMKDTHLPTIPNGTVFRFSFDVDKYGKVSNIQTYSDTPAYTPYAIQYIAPVIRNYQGKNILNFPQGTNRVTTNVKGAWKISNNTRYSTPKDYNDTEVINR